MLELSYSEYNKKSFLVIGDRNKYSVLLKTVKCRWDGKGEKGWFVPLDQKEDLDKIVNLVNGVKINTPVSLHEEDIEPSTDIPDSSTDEDISDKESSTDIQEEDISDKESSTDIQEEDISDKESSTDIQEFSADIQEEDIIDAESSTDIPEEDTESSTDINMENTDIHIVKSHVNEFDKHYVNKNSESSIKKSHTKNKKNEIDERSPLDFYLLFNLKHKDFLKAIQKDTDNISVSDKDSDYESSDDDFPCPSSPIVIKPKEVIRKHRKVI